MKKLNLWLLASLFVAAFTLAACGSDDDSGKPDSRDIPGGTEATVEDLVGTWTISGHDVDYTYVFTQTELTINYDGQIEFKGAYTLKDGVLTYDNMEFKPALLKNKAALVLKIVAKNRETGAEYEELGQLLYKKGKTITDTANDIQGNWHWYAFGNTQEIRTALKLTGNKFELIIVTWGEKYVGTFTYNNGLITLNTSEAFTSREPHTGYGELWGNMDPATLEADWAVLDREYWHVDAVSGGPFIANGTEAYGIVANLMALYHKK